MFNKKLKKNMQGSSPSYFWYIGNKTILNYSFISLQFKFNEKNFRSTTELPFKVIKKSINNGSNSKNLFLVCFKTKAIIFI